MFDYYAKKIKTYSKKMNTKTCTLLATDFHSYVYEYLSGYRGVTQGDPPPPTIFNIVVDSMIQHWV